VAGEQSDIVDKLGKVPLFSGCSHRELEAIAASGKEVHHGPGSVIAREGESGLGFFMILDGNAAVDVGGDERAALGPGDSFGEISLLDEGPRTATVTATSDMRLLAVPAWTFKGLLEQHPNLAIRLLKVMAERLRSASATSPTD